MNSERVFLSDTGFSGWELFVTVLNTLIGLALLVLLVALIVLVIQKIKKQ
ncbi:MAG: hypothetical protein AB7C89_04665 [Intestinibacillus sp.]